MSGYGIYESHDFPTYTFQEYPKMVKLANGETIVVHSKNEELRRMADIVGAPATDDPIVQERDALAAKVAELQAQLVKTQEQSKEPPKPADTSIGAMLKSPPATTAVTK